MGKTIVVTGIGTGVGKTVVSAIIAQALKSSYWKPIQAGVEEGTDRLFVEEMTSGVNVLPEAIVLQYPMSPHAAAELEHRKINIEDLIVPEISGDLIIEGAGGLMVPINYDGVTYCDVCEKWNFPVILVSRHYLGSINHTLLTLEMLASRNIEVLGVVFVGEENEATERIILSKSKVPMLARIPEVESVDRAFIQEQADKFPQL